jgi:hypothetical protein
MFVQPVVEVNHVVHAAAAESYRRGPHLAKQREPDSEVVGGLLARETANARERQMHVFLR